MIKRLTGWRARPSIDRDEALRYWLVEHAPLVKQVPGVVRYAQNHSVAGPEEASNSQAAYDGLGEVWFESRESARAALATAEWRAVLEDAATFMDFDRITAVWAEEHVI
jgi:uncharacterized protein (TIGR02118 family)